MDECVKREENKSLSGDEESLSYEVAIQTMKSEHASGGAMDKFVVTVKQESDQSGDKEGLFKDVATPTVKSEQNLNKSGAEESEMSSGDFGGEALFMEEQDITFDKESSEDSDQDWETPASKRSRREEQQDGSSSEDEPHRHAPQRGCASRRPRGRPRGRGRGGPAGASPGAEEKWNDVEVSDITPPPPTFRPANTPGPQLTHTATYTPLQLFQLFFSNSVLQTVITNTNDFGVTRHPLPSKPWVRVTLQDMFSYMALVIYMGIVKCRSFTDYWRADRLYLLPFPKQLMTGKRFLKISQNLHLSSLASDAANEQRRGTAAYDCLCKIRPLYEEIRDACKRNYHPSQELSINKRRVASKARSCLKQYVKNKALRWGYKLFVLSDSRNGYTWDFSVYEGKLRGNGGKGLGYESVMELLDTRLLGSGYKLFMDNFYTSPALFRDLLHKSIWACGTIRTNVAGFPKTQINSMDHSCPRGSLRWIRKDSLLFVQWRNTRDVSLCSTLHTAHGKDTLQRRGRRANGCWAYKDIPVPPVVQDYNRCMGGVDRSDALLTFYEVLHKTKKWYKTFFYHFMDIATVNAFFLYEDLAKAKGVVPMQQKAFRETLVQELAEAGSVRSVPAPAPRGGHHRPVHISADSTIGRLKCRHCRAKTPVKCSSCDVPLCFVPSRDCYNSWHVAN